MGRVIFSLDCEDFGFIFMSATTDPNSLSGWLMKGPVVSLLTVSCDFSEDAKHLEVLRNIQKEKPFHFARISEDRKSIAIYKKVEDVTIKVICFDIMNISNVDNTSLQSVDVSRSMESHLAAAQAQLTSQAAELSELRQRCDQLVVKYAAAADEAAAGRDRLLGAFCRVLNAKKARISELTAGRDADTDSDDSAEPAELPQSQQKRGARGDSGRSNKRKSPTAAAASPKPPAVRRTRSSVAKKP